MPLSTKNKNKITIRLVLDTHEDGMKKLFDKMKNSLGDSSISSGSFSVVSKRLEVGDISVEWSRDGGDDSDWYIYTLIERKTYADLDSALAASSNRYREQKYRFKQLDKKIMKGYLFEGNLERYVASLLPKLRPRHEALIRGAMFNTQFRDNFQVYRTGSLEETVKFLVKLCGKIPKFLEELDKFENIESIENVEKSGKNASNHSELYSEKLKKKTYLDQKACYINQLCMIPLISHSRAVILSRQFSNMDALIKYLKTKGIHSLVELEVEGKKLGKKASENVYRYLLGIEEEKMANCGVNKKKIRNPRKL